jgi:hypothetical protein
MVSIVQRFTPTRRSLRFSDDYFGSENEFVGCFHSSEMRVRDTELQEKEREKGRKGTRTTA